MHRIGLALALTAALLATAGCAGSSFPPQARGDRSDEARQASLDDCRPARSGRVTAQAGGQYQPYPNLSRNGRCKTDAPGSSPMAFTGYIDQGSTVSSPGM